MGVDHQRYRRRRRDRDLDEAGDRRGGRGGRLGPLGADVLDALRLWIHEVVRLELEAVEEPDLTRADPDRPPELTGRPAAYPPPPSCRSLRERIGP